MSTLSSLISTIKACSKPIYPACLHSLLDAALHTDSHAIMGPKITWECMVRGIHSVVSSQPHLRKASPMVNLSMCAARGSVSILTGSHHWLTQSKGNAKVLHGATSSTARHGL